MYAIMKQNPMKTFKNKSNYSESGNQSHGRNFRYTFDYKTLLTEQRLFYEENGFIVIPSLVSLDSVEKYKQRFLDLCEGKIHVPGLIFMKDVTFKNDKCSEKTIYKIHKISCDEELFQYCQLPQILDYVMCFCGPNIKSIQSMMINKPSDAGTLSSRHPLHQDLHYFPLRPAEKIVCSWTAIERVNRANGCLAVIPGSHKGELLAHSYPDWKNGVNKWFYGISELKENDISQRVHLEMKPGDTVFFHPLLIHGSGANTTDGTRKTISCHYAASDCYLIDSKETSQRTFLNEFADNAKKKRLLF